MLSLPPPSTRLPGAPPPPVLPTHPRGPPRDHSVHPRSLPRKEESGSAKVESDLDRQSPQSPQDKFRPRPPSPIQQTKEGLRPPQVQEQRQEPSHRCNLWTTVCARQQMMATRKILDMGVTYSPQRRSVDRMSRRMTVNPSLHHGIVLATPILNPSRCLQVCPQNPSRHSEICPASNHPHLYVLGTRVAVDVTNSHLAKALATVRDGVQHHGGTKVEISMIGRGTDGYIPY
jgi:hypothetical protein